MPNNARYDWHIRVTAVEKEYFIAQLALDRLKADVVAAELVLERPVRDRDLPAATGHLEGTYAVRLYSVFEAALRSFWATVKQSNPPAKDLIDAVAGRRHVPTDYTATVHEVREWRSELVHELTGEATPIPLKEARGRLQRFLSWLPDGW